MTLVYQFLRNDSGLLSISNMKKITHSSGAIEMIPDEKEQASKDKYKGKKKESDFTQKELNGLTIELAKRANLI